MGKRGPKPGERVPYGFTDWNSPLAQREIWGAPKLYGWQKIILNYFSNNPKFNVKSTSSESGKTEPVVFSHSAVRIQSSPSCGVPESPRSDG